MINLFTYLANIVKKYSRSFPQQPEPKYLVGMVVLTKGQLGHPDPSQLITVLDREHRPRASFIIHLN